LIDADHQHRPGAGHKHAPGQLACGASRHAPVLDRLLRHGAQGQQGDADHWRHGVDDGRDHRSDRAEAEEEQHRHEIGEDRHGLHQVEQGIEDTLGPWVPIGRDAEQKAADGAQRHRHDD
jgi:hypothetical protein